MTESQYPENTKVRKIETFLVWEGRYYRVVEIVQPANAKVTFVDFEAPSEGLPKFPPFLVIDKEVTNDPNYQTKQIGLSTN